jgi:hypothetical protein
VATIRPASATLLAAAAALQLLAALPQLTLAALEVTASRRQSPAHRSPALAVAVVATITQMGRHVLAALAVLAVVVQGHRAQIRMASPEARIQVEAGAAAATPSRMLAGLAALVLSSSRFPTSTPQPSPVA